MKLLLISLMLIVGCAKKVAPTPELVVTQPITESDVAIPTEKIINTTEVVIELSTPVPEEEAEAMPLMEELVEAPPIPQKEIKPSFDFDQVFPDSIWTNYMTKRGEYLSLVAYNEYGNARMATYL